jgi:hypothetical protein
MNIALKEWAGIVEALRTGRQILLLRKGGIIEAAREGFVLKHREFLLFPTFEHQHRASIRPEFHQLVTEPDPDRIPIRLLAQVTDIFPAPPNIDDLRRMQEEYIWNDTYLQMRYNYRPDLPLYMILVRAFALPEAVPILNRQSYAGCKSWVNITEEIDVGGVKPVLTDADFSARLQRVS